jgi:hypothetical protein
MVGVLELELAEEIKIEVLLDSKAPEDAVERAAKFRRRPGGQRLRIEAAGNQVQFASVKAKVSSLRLVMSVSLLFVEATPRRSRTGSRWQNDVFEPVRARSF